jgi:hypothetical protein
LVARGLEPYLCIILDVQRVRDQSDRLALEQDLGYISVVHSLLYFCDARSIIPYCTVVDQPKDWSPKVGLFELIDGLLVAAISRVGG